MDKLNRGVIIEIMILLDVKSLLAWSLVNKRFNSIRNDKELWRKKLYQDFEHVLEKQFRESAYGLYKSIYRGSSICYEGLLFTKKILTQDNILNNESVLKRMEQLFTCGRISGTLLWVFKYREYSEIYGIYNGYLGLSYINKYQHPKDWNSWNISIVYFPPIYNNTIQKIWTECSRQILLISGEWGSVYKSMKIGEMMTQAFEKVFLRPKIFPRQINIIIK